MTKVKIKIKIRMKMKIEINTNVNIQKICDDDGTHYGSGFVCSMAKVYVIPPPPFRTGRASVWWGSGWEEGGAVMSSMTLN